MYDGNGEVSSEKNTFSRLVLPVWRFQGNILINKCL